MTLEARSTWKSTITGSYEDTCLDTIRVVGPLPDNEHSMYVVVGQNGYLAARSEETIRNNYTEVVKPKVTQSINVHRNGKTFNYNSPTAAESPTSARTLRLDFMDDGSVIVNDFNGTNITVKDCTA